MTYFFDELDFLAGGRLTDLWYTRDRLWADDTDLVVLGQYIQLPSGQHVDLESDFVTHHLPLRRAGFGGIDTENNPWLFVLQAAPRSMSSELFDADADPYAVLRQSMDSALIYNARAEVTVEGEWDRSALSEVYAVNGVAPEDIEQWTTLDLLQGLLAELTGVDLRTIVAGYPDCAIPDRSHTCQHDVFDDLMTAWANGQLT